MYDLSHLLQNELDIKKQSKFKLKAHSCLRATASLHFVLGRQRGLLPEGNCPPLIEEGTVSGRSPKTISRATSCVA